MGTGDIRFNGINGQLGSASHAIASYSTSGVPTTNCDNKKRKRRPAGTPDPDAEVVSLSPKTLMESDRYVCEICNQGFQRDQNLQMHRRRHKVPWKLFKRSSSEIRKRVYVCPETSCLHHDPCHALGDLVGIKKHYRRKHSNDKQWTCDKCGKGYAVQSDYKAHLKTCGTRGHCCDCGHVFSRVETFIEHQDSCSIAKTKAAMDSSEQTPFVFLKTRNGSPCRSADAKSMTTCSGVSTSSAIRPLKTVQEPAWPVEEQELQFLATNPSSQNSALDFGDLMINEPLRGPSSIATGRTSHVSAEYIRESIGGEIQASHMLQLSIGLPSPDKSTYDSNGCFEIGTADTLPDFHKSLKSISSDAGVSPKETGASRGVDQPFTLSCQMWRPGKNRPTVPKDMLTNKQSGGLDLAVLRQTEVMKSITSCEVITPRPFDNETVGMQIGHDEHSQPVVDQNVFRLPSSRQVKLGLHINGAPIGSAELGGFDILNFRPSKQTKLPEDDLRSLSTQTINNPASRTLEVIMATSIDSRSWNRVKMQMSSSLRDCITTRKAKEQAWHEWNEADTDFQRAAQLQEQAREQLKLAQRTREMARRQLEIAEAELADANKVRQKAQAELADAQLLREQATCQSVADRTTATCHTCCRQFQHAAKNVAWAEELMPNHHHPQ